MTGASTALPAITVIAPRALEAEPTDAASEKRISGETLNTRPLTAILLGCIAVGLGYVALVRPARLVQKTRYLITDRRVLIQPWPEADGGSSSRWRNSHSIN
jgi:hypothetical protein